MKTPEIKVDQTYLNSIDNINEWNRLTAHQKEKINTGIKQADAALGKRLEEVTGRLRRKYGLHG